MARQKRGSAVLQKAERRCTGVKSFAAEFNFGDDLTLEQYTQKIETLRAQIDTYNQALSHADAASNAVEATEAELRSLSERLLMAVAVKYGKDSSEYELAGGTRTSDRKRPRRAIA